MYFHGSPIEGLEWLSPNETTFRKDGKAYVYLSSNRAHAALYAARCPMFPYGFDRNSGLVKYHEPYEGCLEEFYAKKRGYIYTIGADRSIAPLEGIRYGYRTNESVRVEAVEVVGDVFQLLRELENNEKIIMIRFKDLPDRMRARYHKQLTEILTREEIFSSDEDYPRFLKAKFPDAWEEARKARKQSGIAKT
jgi:hypothetical protein